jgi:hypothetical protein
MFVQGLTPSEVVHGYGDVCQSITELAVETHAQIDANDFRVLNRCLDDAIAAAITKHERDREAATTDQSNQNHNRMGALVDQMRVSVLAVRVAYEAIQAGYIGPNGSTGMELTRRLDGLNDLHARMQVAIGADAT